MKKVLPWLLARPVAHRGLHDAAAGVLENTASAVSAAIEAGYAIEVDLQVTREGDAVVYHDDELGRLTSAVGLVACLSVPELRQLRYRESSDRIMTIGELCELVAGRATLLLELKSHNDGDLRLVRRVANVLAHYRGPVAAMSFDPRQVRAMRAWAPSTVCGLVAEPPRSARALLAAPPYFYRVLQAAPQFIAYAVWALPGLIPTLAQKVWGAPILAWTVRSEQQRESASHWADQIIFEGIRP